MSQFSASIEFKFSSNFKKVSKSISRSAKMMRSDFKKLGSEIKANEQSFRDFGSFLKRGFLVGLVALTGAFAIATVKALEYDKAIAQLSAITGLAGRELDNFGKQSIEASNRFGVTAANYLEAVQLVASAKPELLKQPQLLKKITDEAAILSKAAGIDLKDAAVSLTDAMNQFELGATDASRAINVLAAGSKFGASLVGDTAQALVKSGVAARAVGASFEETNAIIQVLSQRGIKGAMAGTQMRGIFIKLAGVMDNLGAKTPTEAMEKLSKMQLSATQVTKLFGQENFTAASILLKSTKKVRDMTAAVSDTQIATEQAKINMQTFGERIARLKQKLANALMVGFEPVINALGLMADKAGILFGFLGKYPKLITVMIAGFTALVAALGAAAVGMSAAIFAATGGAAAFAAAASAVVAFTVALLANPITWIVVGIVALITALAVLIAKWDALRIAVVSTGKTIMAIIKGLWKGIKEALTPTIDALFDALSEAAEPFKALFSIFDEFLQLFGTSKQELFNVSDAASLFGKILGAALQVGIFPLRMIIFLFNSLKDVVQSLGYLLTGQFDEALDSLKNFVARGKRLLAPFVDNLKAIAGFFDFGDEPATAQAASASAGNSAASLEAQKVITKQSLDVNLKVDGPAKVSSIKSDNKLNTSVETSLMTPEFE